MYLVPSYQAKVGTHADDHVRMYKKVVRRLILLLVREVNKFVQVLRDQLKFNW